MRWWQREREIKPLLRNIPVFSTQLIKFLLQNGNPQGAIAAPFRRKRASFANGDGHRAPRTTYARSDEKPHQLLAINATKLNVRGTR
jgi:hypothetical protein